MCTRQSSGEEPSCQAGDRGDVVTIPGPGRSPGKGNCNLLQYFCLESSMDRRAWQTTVPGVAKNRIRLSTYTTHNSDRIYYDHITITSYIYIYKIYKV